MWEEKELQGEKEQGKGQSSQGFLLSVKLKSEKDTTLPLVPIYSTVVSPQYGAT